MADRDRFELSWSGTAVKWVAITDRWTGKKAIGRDHGSWSVAMEKAVAQMQRWLSDGETSPIR